ncbi:hypothetical protein [Leeia oryzae]|uniref:hypothetical protein n=1 Tax=Leeia oryzae TaxID=356662 RepID=UPI00035EFC08|nr:hypothetical protein [Leeia oryzae]
MQESIQIQINLPVPLMVADEFLADPSNYSLWASGLGAGIKSNPQSDWWMADTPLGPVQIRFSSRNRLGIFDHWVKLADGTEVYIPMRLIGNQEGCLLVFTLFRQPGMSDEQYASDKAWVENDLQQLKDCLHVRSSG